MPSYELVSHELISDAGGNSRILAELVIAGASRTVTGAGNGPIAAFVDALRRGLGAELDVVDYAEHALGQGADAAAVAYVETVDGDGTLRWGVGARSEERRVGKGWRGGWPPWHEEDGR